MEMKTDDALSAHGVKMLVPIRLALEAALLQARTAGRYRRGAAVVALDAVVERTVNLCASARGMPTSQKLDDTISKLRNDPEFEWRPKVLPDVRHLRKARNAAQHDGLEPDREFVPEAASTTEICVIELIEAQYGIDVRTITLSQAITDAELRSAFESAENARALGNYHQCIQHVYRAYLDALRKWNSIRSRHSTSFRADKVGTHVHESLSELETALDAATFVGDVGAAEWFSALGRDANSDVFDDEDASRALAFAFSWITGFESASATWTHDRRLRAAMDARNVRTGTARAEIASAVATMISPGSGMIGVRFELDNVPPADEYDEWAKALRDQLGREDRPHYWVNSDGTVQVTRPESEAQFLAGDTEAIAAALEAVEGRVVAQRAVAAEAAKRREQTAQEMTDATAARREDWPLWVRGIEGRDDQHHGKIWALRLQPSLYHLQLLDEIHAPRIEVTALLREQAGVEECWYRAGEGIIVEMVLAGSAEEVLRVLWNADRTITAALSRERDLRSREEVILLDVNSALAITLQRVRAGVVNG